MVNLQKKGLVNLMEQNKHNKIASYSYRERHNIFEKSHTLSIALSNIFVIFCTILAIAFIVFQLIFDNAPVVGKSMYPTLNITGADTDRVYINKHATVKRGDIVVLSIDHWDEGDSKNIIKRVIGIEGDKISFTKDEQTQYYYLVRNGEKLNEPYLSSYAGNEKKFTEFTLMCEHSTHAYLDQEGSYVYQVPKGEIFVLGDNRLNSSDSAVRGSFEKSTIWGRVDYVTPKEMNIFIFFFQQFLSCGYFHYHI